MVSEHRALDAAVRQMWTEDEFAARGLPESTIEVVPNGGAYYAVLKSRVKASWAICRLPGLPKDERFLVETADQIITYLIDEAKALPDAPRWRYAA